jgi:hypothetical protein
MLLIPLIDVTDVNNSAHIIECMQDVQENEIACVNWPEEYPAKPKVSFKMAHNGTHLFLHYFVEEDEILAKTEEDNGPVWTDSCVEFFINFGDSPYYYNAEFSCIGKALLAYRPGREGAVHASSAIMNSIKRYPSLGTKTFDKKKGNFKWDLLVVIPVTAYWQSGLTTFSGVKAKANFYKCGDDLSVPHYISWNPILTKEPNFHAPQFFGEIEFK